MGGFFLATAGNFEKTPTTVPFYHDSGLKKAKGGNCPEHKFIKGG